MALLGLQNIHYTIGGLRLFGGVGLQLEAGDRLCLVGRNGAGKSTLLQLMAGRLTPDQGEVSRRQGLRLALVEQDPGPPRPSSVLATAREAYPGPGDEAGHDLRLRRTLSRLELDPEDPFDALSGGKRRRVLLAGALASEPDLLLLDEPTNHLDMETITWLEDELTRRAGALVFVTHDRRFARNLATRVAEVDGARLITFACGWTEFLERRDAVLEAEARRLAEFEKKLAQEEVWVRRGVKARLKRNEGRVKALEAMRRLWQERRRDPGQARLDLQDSGRGGDLVLDVRDLAFAYPGHTVVAGFSRLVLRGEKIGLIGRNGSGKTTLLRLLLGELSPSSGSVRHGTGLSLLYFDQLRAQLDLTRSVAENVAGASDTVEVNGKAQHVLGYLDRFLFSPERARARVSVLSGGERNRLLLAKLFTRPGNVLVLDEPTNDLDAETLNLLEEVLADFGGTVFLVSHDRDFLDNVVTSTWWLPGDGRVDETPGGWSDWAQRQERRRVEQAAAKPAAASAPAGTAPGRPAKRSYKEERELEALPGRIEALEAERTRLHDQAADPAFFRTDPTRGAALSSRLAELETELEAAYARWQVLEN